MLCLACGGLCATAAGLSPESLKPLLAGPFWEMLAHPVLRPLSLTRCLDNGCVMHFSPSLPLPAAPVLPGLYWCSFLLEKPDDLCSVPLGKQVSPRIRPQQTDGRLQVLGDFCRDRSGWTCPLSTGPRGGSSHSEAGLGTLGHFLLKFPILSFPASTCLFSTCWALGSANHPFSCVKCTMTLQDWTEIPGSKLPNRRVKQ